MQNRYSEFKFETALDEVGRGCLAGPVVAAAVILPVEFQNSEINDSKKLSEKKRKNLDSIIKNVALEYAIAEVDSIKIDEINILKASFLAMHKALDKFKTKSEFLLVDGNRFIKYKKIPHFCAIKGDANFLNIAAASIIAKNYRDDLMNRLHEEYPVYNWKQNKGYPTKEHRKAILEHGITPYHRKSFRLLDSNYTLEF